MTQDPATITAALREVYDPCCADRGISIVDMGVVEDVRVDGAHVEVDLVLTTGWCPFVASMSTPSPTACASSRASTPSTSRSSGTRSGPWTASRRGREKLRCRSRSWSPTAAAERRA